MNVTVTRETTCCEQGGAVILTGTCDGREVSFAVDPRYAGDLAEAVAEDGQVTAVIEDWQLRSP